MPNLNVVEQFDDFSRKFGPSDKWFRYFDALAKKYQRLWEIHTDCKQKLDHYMIKCRDVEEQNSKYQANVVKLKTALQSESDTHHLAKLQIRKLVSQMKSAKDYMQGIDALDERTMELINTMCTSPRPYHPSSATVLNEKSGSLLDDFDENSVSTEGSLSNSADSEIKVLQGGGPKEATRQMSVSSASSDDYIDSDNRSLRRRSLRKRSSTDIETDDTTATVSKKVKGGDVAASLTVAVDSHNCITASAKIATTSRSHRRSKSLDTTHLLSPHKSDLPSAPSCDDLFKTPGKYEGSPMYRSNSASKLTNRQHNFVTKTVMVFENCAKCKRRLKFYRDAFRCIDCNVAVHGECREEAPLPCIPTVCKTPVKGKHKLQDFCPSFGPRVPPILINCFHELEKSQRIKEVGLYRMCGQRTEVQSVARKLQKHVNHDLSGYDTHTITGVVKDFLLHSLSEPLIPSSMYNRFAKVTDISHEPLEVERNLKSELEGLPPCNRDTLAYVMLHMTMVEQITDNKMNKDCLTKVFAPTIVGYSLQAQINPAMMNQEVTQRIMGCLLSLDPSFWDNIIVKAQKKATTLLPRDRTPQGATSKNLSFASPKIV